jgi:sensor histidine kinase YesM
MEKISSRKNNLFLNRSLRTRLIVPVIVTMFISLCINLVLFKSINTTVGNMEQVYATNIRLGELERLLTEMETSIYQYLNIQNPDALESFREDHATFEIMIQEIDDTITDHPARRMERNIRRLGLSYLELTETAVQAKQDHDVAQYKESFEEIQKIYRYLLEYIRGLDSMRFQANSRNYDVLYQYLRYLEIFMIVVLILVTGFLMFILYAVIGNIIRPLEKLAGKAREVEKGNFGIELEQPDRADEVGTVTMAFNQMITSINAYIQRTRESMELESLLKDAQLKYYQAQINPHFLFNTLNAGLQLAMMEDAERTYAFIENMAAFFRYRLKKNGEASTLKEEIELIDSYMYIMNVRFSNEIHLEKEIDARLLDMQFPGMVLQPLIENALHHGLRDVEWEKRIEFFAGQENGNAEIWITDNGVGMTEEMMQELNSDERIRADMQKDSGNGVGLWNVRERLRLYFEKKDVLRVESDGIGKGTSVIICVPIRRNDSMAEEEKTDVQDSDRG